MSGNFPDPIGRRMAYDRDGTLVTRFSSMGIGTDLSTANKRILNGEVQGDVPGGLEGGGYHAFVFPEPRELSGYWNGYSQFTNNAFTFESSIDSTNGQDGTWVTHGAPWAKTNGLHPLVSMRTEQRPLNVTGATAVRLRNQVAGGNNLTVGQIHIYGRPTAPQGNRLDFWSPDLDQLATSAHFEWGDRPRNTTAYRSFRIKNSSATLTATTITVLCEAISDANPTMVSQYQFSLDGGAYANTVQIASLAPGQISPVITARQQLTSATAAGLWWQRFVAEAVTWA